MLKDEQIKKIKELNDKGFSISRISREMNIDRKTVRKYLARGDKDEHNLKKKDNDTEKHLEKKDENLETS